MGARATSWGAYKAIAESLRHRVAEGEFRPKSMLPSEAQLVAEYHVSRNTLRRSLSDLEDKGLIRSLPGRGRVVVAQGEDAEHPGAPLLQYQRIAGDLRERIGSGDLLPGAVVPSEAALVELYGVSRGTARQALIELQGAGLIEVKQGKGRFVSLDLAETSEDV
ncbi:DNA-binding GntR family transcriptional regulator [Catenulispora sp. MAP5-51]|uniref:GntR family transcriptional regulator n=1 Tax=Catenulispora sp. MAP5-51 TaxID=3156298 RepID=UPI003519A759